MAGMVWLLKLIFEENGNKDVIGLVRYMLLELILIMSVLQAGHWLQSTRHGKDGQAIRCAVAAGFSIIIPALAGFMRQLVCLLTDDGPLQASAKDAHQGLSAVAGFTFPVCLSFACVSLTGTVVLKVLDESPHDLSFILVPLCLMLHAISCPAILIQAPSIAGILYSAGRNHSCLPAQHVMAGTLTFAVASPFGHLASKFVPKNMMHPDDAAHVLMSIGVLLLGQGVPMLSKCR